MTINVPRPDKNVTCRFKYSDAFKNYENVYVWRTAFQFDFLPHCRKAKLKSK